MGQNLYLASNESVDALTRLIESSTTLLSLGIDNCQLQATQLCKIFEAIEQSASANTIQKLYLKNNRCDSVTACSQLIKLLAMPESRIESVHTNWTGMRLEMVPGRYLAAISSKSGQMLAEAQTKRIL